LSGLRFIPYLTYALDNAPAKEYSTKNAAETGRMPKLEWHMNKHVVSKLKKKLAHAKSENVHLKDEKEILMKGDEEAKRASKTYVSY
jgi:hypothetical protein